MTREEALAILDTIPTIGEQVDALEMAIEALQERKTGKWKSNLIDTCSECHALCPTINGERTHTPYCPYCGAKMKEE